MNPEQLWETTMDPATRSLIQIHYTRDEGKEPKDAGQLDESVFELLMGQEVPPRRAFIEERAGYARLDI